MEHRTAIGSYQPDTRRRRRLLPKPPVCNGMDIYSGSNSVESVSTASDYSLYHRRRIQNMSQMSGCSNSFHTRLCNETASHIVPVVDPDTEANHNRGHLCARNNNRKLVERLYNIKRRALGNGSTQCLLCGAEFGLFGPRAAAARCFQCKKYVCQKNCGVDTMTDRGQVVFLCKICSEERELWKKTGAWFYNKLPVPLPSDDGSNMDNSLQRDFHDAQTAYSPTGHTAPHGASRRRLPNPPLSGARSQSSSKQQLNNRSNDVPSVAQHFRPRWADESGYRSNWKQTTESDSDTSSDGGFRINRRVCRNTHFESDSEPESEPTTSGSAVSSRHESIASPSSAIGDKIQSGLERGAVWSGSDNHSVDSGVVQSDRSLGASSGGTTVVANSSSTSHIIHAKADDREPKASVRSSASTANVRHTPSPTTAATRMGPNDVPPDIPVIQEKQATLVGTAQLSGSTPLIPAAKSGSIDFEVIKKPSTLENLTLNRESSLDVDEHLSSSPDDELSSLGTLEFTLYYDTEKMTLTIHILRARNLRAMDANGFSDPYVKVHMLPGATKSTQLRTKTIDKSLNPDWDEKLTYYGVIEEEMHKKTLRFTVFDEDRFGHDFLGETRVPLKRLVPGHERKYNVYLEKQMPVEKGDEINQERGKVLISLLYVSSKSLLVVGIIRCAELIGMDQSGYSDPYVRIHLKPDKKLRFKTPVKKRTCNPEFNCEFNIPCALEDLPKKSLEVTVFDRDVGKSDDYIGGVQFTASAKGERLRHWTDCLKSPNQRIERWHKLSEERF